MNNNPFQLDPRLAGKQDKESQLPFLVGASSLVFVGLVAAVLYVLFVINGGW